MNLRRRIVIKRKEVETVLTPPIGEAEIGADYANEESVSVVTVVGGPGASSRRQAVLSRFSEVRERVREEVEEMRIAFAASPLTVNSRGRIRERDDRVFLYIREIHGRYDPYTRQYSIEMSGTLNGEDIRSEVMLPRQGVGDREEILYLATARIRASIIGALDGRIRALVEEEIRRLAESTP